MLLLLRLQVCWSITLFRVFDSLDVCCVSSKRNTNCVLSVQGIRSNMHQRQLSKSRLVRLRVVWPGSLGLLIMNPMNYIGL